MLKEAVKEGDVVIYTGHSGLGGNLDLNALEELLGADIEFVKGKRQLFYIDSCSSYSYYTKTFRAKRPRQVLSLMINGLSSYFGQSQLLIMRLIEHLLNPSSNPSWLELLADLEQQNGRRYLLNVNLN